MGNVNPIISRSFETDNGTFIFSKEDGYNKPYQVEVRDRYNHVVENAEIQILALEIFERYLEVEHGCEKCTAMSLIWGGASSATLISIGTSLPNDQLVAKIALCTIGAVGAALSLFMGRCCYPRGEPQKILNELNEIEIPLALMRPTMSFRTVGNLTYIECSCPLMHSIQNTGGWKTPPTTEPFSPVSEETRAPFKNSLNKPSGLRFKKRSFKE